MTKLAYSVDDIVGQIPLKKSAVYDLIARGDLPGRKLKDKTVVLHDDLVAFLAALAPHGPASGAGEAA